ncbi:protease pro-enzyme activation domain-containing protein [Streptacidiphilus monticola]
MTPAQVDQRFGATPQQVAAVRSWLTSAGLTVFAADRHSLTVHGTVAAVQRAFAVQLRNFRKGGHTYRAPDRDASVPASVASAVLSVTGLSNAPHKAGHDDTLPPPDAAFVNAGPLSAYYGEKTATTLPQFGGVAAPTPSRATPAASCAPPTAPPPPD